MATTTPPGGPNPPNPGNQGNSFDPNAFAQGLFDLIRQNEEARKLKDEIELQTSYLRTQKTLRSEILSLSKKLYEISRDIEYLEDKELGTKETVLSIDKEINKALKAEKQLKSDIASIEKDQSIEAQNLKTSLDQVVAQNQKNIELLNEQKKLSEQIRNNFGVKPYSLLAEIFEKIGGKASLLSAPFEKGAKAARESAKENLLNNKKIIEQETYKKKLQSAVANGGRGINRQLAEELNLRDRNGNLLLGAFGRQKALSKLNNLPAIDNPMGKLEIGMKAFTSGLKGLTGGLTGLLKGGWIGALIGIGKFFLDAMFAADERITNIAKNFSVSKDRAAGIYESIIQIKYGSDNILETTKNLTEAFIELRDITEFIVEPLEDQVKLQVALTKNLGLSKDEALGFQQALVVSNVAASKGEEIIYNQVAAFANQNKLLGSGKQIMVEISKTSKLIQLNFKDNLAGLVNTTLEAKKLGLTLDQVSKIGDSLLNFESSITAELEAELITGRELNLEQARYYALTNDIAGLTKEIAAQGITAESFAQMNRIEQQKIAAALGMQTDELADSLYKADLLEKVSKGKTQDLRDQAKVLRDQGNALGDQKKISQAIQLEAKASAIENAIYTGKSLEEAEKSVSAQDKFNVALEKAQELFSDLVTGGTLDALSDILLDIIEGLEDLGYGNKAKRLSKEKAAEEKELQELVTKSKSGILDPEEIKQMESLANNRAKFDVDFEQAVKDDISRDIGNQFGTGIGFVDVALGKIVDWMASPVKGSESLLANTKGQKEEAGKNESSDQIMKDVRDALVTQNAHLATMAAKDPNFYLNSTKLNDALSTSIND
jgi:hypothetical protein